MLSDEIKHLLSQYIDDLLDETNRRRIESLLKSDKDVAEYYRQLLKLGEMADEFEPEMDSNFWERQEASIIKKIENAEQAGIEPLPVRKGIMSYKWLAIAASIAVVAIISIFEIKYDSPDKIPFTKKLEIKAPVMASKPVVDNKAQKADFDKGRGNETMVASKPDIINKDKKTVGEGELTSDKMTDRPKKKIAEQQKQNVERLAGTGEIDELTDLAIPQDESANIKNEDLGNISIQDEIETEKKGQPIDDNTEVESYTTKSGPPSEALKREFIGIPTPIPEISSDADVGSTALKTEEHYQIEKQIKVTADRSTFDEYKISAAPQMGFRPSNDTLAFGGNMQYAEEYKKWRTKYDSLELQYSWQLTASQRHRIESVAKSNRTELPPPTDEAKSELAEACFNIARLTPYDQEKKGFIEMLDWIKSIADDSLNEKIDNYLSDLQSESK